MHEMKLSPLPGGERTQNRMIRDLRPASKTLLALADARVHGGDVLGDLREDSLEVAACGQSPCRCPSAFRHVAHPGNHEGAQAIFQSGHGCRRLSCSQTTIQNDLRSRVGKRKVLQNFPYAPLTRRVYAEFIDPNSGRLVCNEVRQFLQR